MLSLSASPAAAKFWAFDLEVDRSEALVGQPIRVHVTVAPEFARASAGAPAMLPPVNVYRTDDLPVSGPMSGNERQAEQVNFTSVGDGEFRGEIVLSAPGSYQLVSMGIWNHEPAGYPAPVPLEILPADHDPKPTANSAGFSPLPLGIAAAVVIVLGTLVAWTRRASA